jgi:hypothetical protein
MKNTFTFMLFSILICIGCNQESKVDTGNVNPVSKADTLKKQELLTISERLQQINNDLKEGKKDSAALMTAKHIYLKALGNDSSRKEIEKIEWEYFYNKRNLYVLTNLEAVNMKNLEITFLMNKSFYEISKSGIMIFSVHDMNIEHNYGTDTIFAGYFDKWNEKELAMCCYK